MTARLAIVGCGAVLENLHRPAIDRLRRRGSLEIAAVVDPVASMRRRAAEWFEPALPCSTLSEALEADVTCVMLLSPPATHVDAILEALNCGIDVFCEKPLAADFAGTKFLLENPDRNRVSIGMIRRQFDTMSFLRSHVRTLIDISDFRIQYSEGDRYSWPIVSEDSFRQDTGGVGVILDTGVHILDLLTWIFGPASLCHLSTDATSEFVARNASLGLEFEGGSAIIRLSWTDPLPSGLRVESRLGSIWVPPGTESVIFQRPEGEQQWRRLSTGESTGPSWIGYRRPRCRSSESAAFLQLIDFLDPSHGRLASVDEAAAVLKMLDDSA
jgi:predicted dehydrogenase